MAGDQAAAGWRGAVLKNRWRAVAPIGRGGVGTVYRAVDRDGSPAAIKFMHPQLARDADARARFLREPAAASRVGHRGVVRVLDHDVTSEGTPYLVMELLQDGELLEERRVAAGGTLPYREVAHVGAEVLDVLAAAHEQGVIHRDVKPDNVFLFPDGSVKILDFGVAHLKEGRRSAEATATGILLGTPDFMAPEQALGARGTIDASTDLFAVGAMLFFLVSGRPVHEAKALTELLVALTTRPARSLGSLGLDLPPAFVTVVDRALALEKPRRWPSARAMQLALRDAVPDAALEPRLRHDADAPVSSITEPRRPSFDVDRRETILATGDFALGAPLPPPVAPPPPSGRAWTEGFADDPSFADTTRDLVPAPPDSVQPETLVLAPALLRPTGPPPPPARESILSTQRPTVPPHAAAVAPADPTAAILVIAASLIATAAILGAIWLLR